MCVCVLNMRHKQPLPHTCVYTNLAVKCEIIKLLCAKVRQGKFIFQSKVKQFFCNFEVSWIDHLKKNKKKLFLGVPHLDTFISILFIT
jgi:hypothetical protein